MDLSVMTKEQLLADLETSRQRILALEHQLAQCKKTNDELSHAKQQAESKSSVLDTTIDSIAEGLFVLDINGQLVRMNQNAAQLFGYDMNTPPFSPSERLAHFRASNIDGAILTKEELPGFRALKGETITGAVISYHPDDKMPFWAEVNAAPIRGDAGTITGSIVTFQDVTKRIEAEIALQESEANIRLLVEYAPDAIFIHHEGKFIFINQATLKLFGADSANDLIGKAILDRVHPDSRNAIVERIRKLDKERKPLPMYELRYLRLDGSTIEVEVAVVPFVFIGKQCVLVFARDITERKRIQELMVQSEKMLTVGGLAAGMAHEINNPLGGILLSLQNIKRRLSPHFAANASTAGELGCSLDAILAYLRERRIMAFLDAIEESGRRASSIVSNMLDFSRTNSSGRTLADVNELIDKSISLCSTEYEPSCKCDFKNLLIERDYDPGIPPVPCVPSQIEQVLVNILQNAMQALEGRSETSQPGKIMIRTRARTGSVCIEIEDNGPGMDPTVRKRAFDPFFTTKPVGKGTGLGLSVSYFIITNNHGGTIELDSSPGGGAHFIIRLPVNKGLRDGPGGGSDSRP